MDANTDLDYGTPTYSFYQSNPGPLVTKLLDSLSWTDLEDWKWKIQGKLEHDEGWQREDLILLGMETMDLHFSTNDTQRAMWAEWVEKRIYKILPYQRRIEAHRLLLEQVQRRLDYINRDMRGEPPFGTTWAFIDNNPEYA